jgi:predicted lactoylglutathione lyase
MKMNLEIKEKAASIEDYISIGYILNSNFNERHK